MKPLLQGKTAAPAVAVAQPDPVRVASPNDPDVRAASKFKAVEDMKNRRGRQSTRLFSGAQDTAYTRTTLG